MPRLTIGLPSCRNHVEVWFTVQALRLYQDLADAEILIVDTADDHALRSFAEDWARVRYVSVADADGPAAAKDRVFAHANGDFVLCMDSHVLLPPGAVSALVAWITAHPECADLLHGPLLYDTLDQCADAMHDEWRGQMWGTWRAGTPPVDADPYEIPMHGMGVFVSRRDSWLGFNPAFRGFGGEEGYIHAKYRQAGRRVICLPFLRWCHYFRPSAAPYPVKLEDRIHNYRIGLDELGIDKARMHEHFGISA